MKISDIRLSFLKYFEEKGHKIVQSSSLVPGDDPTLLFANSGMVQFKDCFLGTDKRAYTRATTCQKCLRISGKHNDLENVGRTARHHTFFEMLGNFSFGDYFKRDAIQFAWELLTVRLGLDKKRLWVTIYEEDDEAGELWKTLTDVLPGRILKCGKEDNFWAMGETGPCGPCSEIHYYLGSNIEGQSEAEFRKGDGTYIEIWNLVFMQYNRDVTGKLAPLPKPSVDTGMGLERIAAVKQGVTSNYDTDQLRDIITFTETLAPGKKYDGRDYTERDPNQDPQYAIDVAHRVIADHVRACTFLIADGVSPASDGRGYVLRRLIRRAVRHGRVLGFNSPFLFKVAGKTVELMGDVYPEIAFSREKILRQIEAEEGKFLATLDSGLTLLKKGVSETKGKGARILPGSLAFQLHDTYGFPLDLTQDLVRLDGMAVDIAGFQEQMDAQRERSRSARASEADLILQKMVKPLPTAFVGYEFLEYESAVQAIFGEAGEMPTAESGTSVVVLTKETPFFGESGGQIGDTGRMSTNNAVLDVLDTQKIGGESIMHICRVVEGAVSKNDRVRMSVDAERRALLRVNHSATHLMHLALREVLGDHVKQAGSRVGEHSLRFDFSHFEALSHGQIDEIERIVNNEIRANAPVVTEILALEDAKRTGAMALFGEKYGEKVRVVSIGPRSKELCGGTHVTRAGDIGFFTFLKEGAVSAGVRRVEAAAGSGAVQNYMRQIKVLKDLSGMLQSGELELADRVQKLLEKSKELERKIERHGQSTKSNVASSLSEQAVITPKGFRVIATVVDEASPKDLREMADDLKQRLQSGCIALGSVVDGKGILLTAVTEDLVSKYHAGDLLQEISKIVGGKGGGRADLAQAGGGDPNRLEQGLQRFRELVQ